MGYDTFGSVSLNLLSSPKVANINLRFINLRDGYAIFATKDPRSSDHLPVDERIMSLNVCLFLHNTKSPLTIPGNQRRPTSHPLHSLRPKSRTLRTRMSNLPSSRTSPPACPRTNPRRKIPPRRSPPTRKNSINIHAPPHRRRSRHSTLLCRAWNLH